MKLKISLLLLNIVLLSGCSGFTSIFSFSNDEEESINVVDSEIENVELQDAGLTLPPQDPNFIVPKIKENKTRESSINIRPPLIPMAIIPSSVANFDGERAFIVYPLKQKDVYNLKQVARVLKDNGINSSIEGAALLTDWVIDNLDDKLQIMGKYKIEQIINQKGSAIVVLLNEMKSNDQLVIPSKEQKQRYTVNLLNKIIGTLNQNYQQQLKALRN